MYIAKLNKKDLKFMNALKYPKKFKGINTCFRNLVNPVEIWFAKDEFSWPNFLCL